MEKIIDKYLPSMAAFKAMQSSSIMHLSNLSESDLRVLLPALVRTSLCVPLDLSETFASFQQEVQRKIADADAVNSIKSILSVDFNMVHEDASKEQQLRRKLGPNKLTDNLLSESLQKGLILEFEESDSLKRTRLVLSEVLRIMNDCKENDGNFALDDTELFECAVYVEEIADVLCLVFAELPFLLPAPEVAEALLRVKYGPVILCRIVANNPDCFEIVCSSILSHTKSKEEFELETQVRTKALKMLCGMNARYRKTLRAECVSLCKLVTLSIELSIDLEHESGISDVVPFFTGILLASDSKTKSWIADYIKSAQKEHKESALSLFKAQLIKEMKIVIKTFKKIEDNSSEDMETDDVTSALNNYTMHGIAMMRLYCALKTMTGFKLSHDDADVLIDLITCQPSPSPVGVRFIVVSICTLIASAFLLHTHEREQKITTWLKELVSKSSKFDEEADYSASFGETLLLISIHFHGHTLEPIVNLVSSTMGIKLKPSSLTKIKILFTQQVFPEKVVAEHALTVPVTQHLSANMKGFLPVHCVHQLMKSRTFTKNDISVKDWLFKQLCSCATPVHSLMLPLIKTYVHSVITPLNVSKTKQEHLRTLDPFEEAKILDVFCDKGLVCSDLKTTQLLFMVYALTYQNALLQNMKNLVTNPKSPREYSPLLYSTIPMKQLLLLARAQEESYGDLYPPLLHLLTTHYPHLCLVEDWIEEEENISHHADNGSHKGADITGDKCSIDGRGLVNLEESTQKSIRKLTRLTLLPAHRLIEHLDALVELLPKLLNVNVPQKIHLLVVKIWMKLNTVVPRKLWLKTVNVLRQQPSNIKHEWEKTPAYSEEEIQKDPLIVLRCDSKVFRCPSLFDIVMRILNGYLTSSRALLSHHLLANPVVVGSKPVQEVMAAEQEREELKFALTSAQESAAIQLLLEVCLPTDIERKTSTYSVQSTLREIQAKVCCFIHQSFILQPSMAKLIHFQGYPSELLSVTVPGVPSMHICIDFIPELLNQPHLQKQLFAVQLISHLAVQYPIPKSYSMSAHVASRMKNLLAALPVAKRNQFFVPALDCLVRICKAFPPLREEVTEFFLTLGKVALSQRNKTSLTGIPMLELQNVGNSANSLEDIDDGMEIDSCTDESRQAKEINVNASLDGDNPAFSRDTNLKVYGSKELCDATASAFKSVTDMSLSEKLVIVDDEAVVKDAS